MTTKTYYAKLDCYSSIPGNGSLILNEHYKNFCDFMSYLTASNVATLVSWNSGSGAVSGSFDERTYWDGAKPFGLGTHSLWKFHTSSTRNWEWYMYVQAITGSTSANQSFNVPVTGWGSTDSLYGWFGIIAQTATCFSGSDSFNPWNGTVSDGASTAGNPRWVSGSNDRTLYVLPRSNDTGGENVVQKANHLTIAPYHESNISTQRSHFIYDGDSLLILYDKNTITNYSVYYFGSYELRNSLSGSGICDSDHGFLMYSQWSAPVLPNTIDLNTSFGSVNASAGFPQNGGVAVPIKAAISGSKGGIFNIMGTFPGATYQPNTVVNKFEEYPIYVGFNESSFVGLVGTFNTGLLRTMRDVQVHDTTADFSRAVFGGSTTVSNLKISVPWTGSSPPGIGTDRTGSNYTWTTDYR